MKIRYLVEQQSVVNRSSQKDYRKKHLKFGSDWRDLAVTDRAGWRVGSFARWRADQCRGTFRPPTPAYPEGSSSTLRNAGNSRNYSLIRE